MSDLGTLGGSSSQGNAINDSGQVVDSRPLQATFSSPPSVQRRPGGYERPRNGSGRFREHCICDQQRGAGHRQRQHRHNHAFLYTDSMIDLGATISNTLGYPNSIGLAINAGGDVVGQASTTLAPTIQVGFLYSKRRGPDRPDSGRRQRRSDQ